MTKTKIALAIALMLGVASAAQAGTDNDGDTTGGYRVGPLGQSFSGANPAFHPSMGAYGYYGEGYAGRTFDYVPTTPHHKPSHTHKAN